MAMGTRGRSNLLGSSQPWNSGLGEMPVETVSRRPVLRRAVRHCLISTRTRPKSICPSPQALLASKPSLTLTRDVFKLR